MRLRTLFICLLLVWVGGCNPWRQISASDPKLGPALLVKRAVAPEIPWHTWVVLENPSPYPVQVAFRANDGTTKCHKKLIGASGRVALKIGEGDVEFLFRRGIFSEPEASLPKLIDRVSGHELKKKYRHVPRL